MFEPNANLGATPTCTTVDQSPLADALRYWLPSNQSIQIWPVAPGLSGGHVHRVDVIDPVATSDLPSILAMKCGPLRSHGNDTTAASTRRRKQADEIIRQAFKSCSILTPPLRTVEGDTSVHLKKRDWQCFAWRSGKPIDQDASADDVSTGIRAIAEIHHALVAADPKSDSCSTMDGHPRCIRERIESLQRIPDVLQHSRGPDRFPPELARSLSAAYQVLRDATATHRLAALLQSLEQKRSKRLPVQWVMRDIHREHLLFHHNPPATESSAGAPERKLAVIDTDAMDRDCPSVDLARWLGGFPDLSARLRGSDEVAADWSPMVLQANHNRSAHDYVTWAASAYRQKRPFSYVEEELVVDLLASGTLGSLANWVRWIDQENRRFAWSASQLALRINELIVQSKVFW